MIARPLLLKSTCQALCSSTSQEGRRNIPKYERIKRALLDYIVQLPEEQEFLPYEKDLAEAFGVSRCTIAKALEKLRRGGYIETSKKSGSRIICRNPARPVLHREPMENIGFLFANNDASSARTTDFRWQLLDATEQIFSTEGVRTIAYNLRENNWQTWRDPEVLAASLEQRGIRFAVFRYGGQDRNYDWRNHLLALRNRGIKIVLLFQDSTELTTHGTLLMPGTDYLLVNNHDPMLQALEQYFTSFDRFFYLSNAAADWWAEPRRQLCQNFCETHRIPFTHLRSSYFLLQDEDRLRQVPDIDETCTRQFLNSAAGGGRIVCFCANDYSAASFHFQLRKQNIDPARFEIVGFDNLPEFRSLNLSTFDFDAHAQAKALLECGEEFRREPGNVLHRSRGIMTYARFVNRHTGQS